jgi:uncharacterized protein
MLIGLRLENFKSFKNEVELSLAASASEKSISEATVPVTLPGTTVSALLTAAAIYGPNASGKTNILLAIDALRDAVRDSQTDWKPTQKIPIEPHFHRVEDPTRLEIEFTTNDVRYRYGFLTNRDRFISEWLYSYPKGRERVLFERNVDELNSGEYLYSYNFGQSLSGHKREFDSSSRRVRQNSLFLSVAAQDNQQECLEAFNWISSKISLSFSESEYFGAASSILSLRLAKFKKLLLSLLKLADPSIVDFDVTYDGEISDINDEIKDYDKFDDMLSKIDVKFKFGPKSSDVLNFENESRGVKRLYLIAAHILYALEFGSVVVIDELEASMHPHIAARLLAIFQNESSNPKRAQLLFTTHETRFLSLTHLRRDQIWFCEKTDLASELFSLMEFAPRKDLDIQSNYMRGRFGAIPTSAIDPVWLETVRGKRGE